jgi:hypothetical protein
MLPREELFGTGDKEKIWQKYCSFLDLSLDEFMEIQNELLMQQIDLVFESPLAKKFMAVKPKSVSEFRQSVPLTTFEDYQDYLQEENDNALPVKPYCWCRTSGRGGAFKWVPYNEKNVENMVKLSTAMLIMACTDKKGKVNIGYGIRVLLNVPPPPYLSGIMGQLSEQYLDGRSIPPLAKYGKASFEERIQAGFGIALRDGVDLMISLTSVIVKMGEQFADNSRKLKFSRKMLHPAIITRLTKAVIRSKREGRPILPKDLWPLKGLVCYGTDTSIYRNQLIHYWGVEPFEMYASTESGIIAMNSWKKKQMTFVPFSSFLEFIPEEECIKNREDKSYSPRTVLLPEVQPNTSYEMVVSSFNGMPFFRYRLGDIIKVTALKDEETGIAIPQAIFQSRIDDIIDIAGFIRFDEKTIWQAIFNSGIKYEDWSARKEYERDKPILRLYIEPMDTMDTKVLEELINQELIKLLKDYRDLESMLGIKPLKITILPPGSFRNYFQDKQKAGVDLAHLKPRHINAPDSVIRELMESPHK